MNRATLVAVQSLLVGLSLGSIINCSGVGFGGTSSSSGSSSSAAAVPGSSAVETGGSSPTPQGTDGAANVTLPQATYTAKPCQAQELCTITFEIANGPLPYDFEFQWETDNKYGQAPPSDDPPYGQPDVDYQTTNWAPVLIKAGQTSATVSIQDINKQGTAVTIPFLMSSCMFNGVAYYCNQIFTN
jgi:hypothetical protein